MGPAGGRVQHGKSSLGGVFGIITNKRSIPIEKIDEIDQKILRELQFNARISNIELAKRVGLSASPCWNRVRSLERSGIVEKYVTVFNQAALGAPDTVIVELRLEEHNERVLRKFEETLKMIPEIIEAYLVTGEYDYYIKVAVSGTVGFEELLRDKLYKMPGITHTRSSFALRCLKQSLSDQVPLLLK